MTDSIPGFDNDGLLPQGDYSVTIPQLRESLLVHGPRGLEAKPTWDAGWRAQLVDNLEILVRQSWQVGISDVFADGSFAEDKDHPNDIDGYFVCDLDYLASGRLQRDLNLLDPHKVWTWEPSSRQPYRGYPKKQLPMWHAYRVELYPPRRRIEFGNCRPTRKRTGVPSGFSPFSAGRPSERYHQTLSG